jgi:hypothetical protein
MLSTIMKNTPFRELLASVPTTEMQVRLPPRPPRQSVETVPTLDALDKAIEASLINLQSYEHRRSDVLRRFDDVRAQFQIELDDINKGDEETQQRVLDLQFELRKRLEKRGLLISVTDQGEMVAVVPSISIPRPAHSMLHDLDDIEARRIANEATEPQR